MRNRLAVGLLVLAHGMLGAVGWGSAQEKGLLFAFPTKSDYAGMVPAAQVPPTEIP